MKLSFINKDIFELHKGSAQKGEFSYMWYRIYIYIYIYNFKMYNISQITCHILNNL